MVPQVVVITAAAAYAVAYPLLEPLLSQVPLKHHVPQGGLLGSCLGPSRPGNATALPCAPPSPARHLPLHTMFWVLV